MMLCILYYLIPPASVLLLGIITFRLQRRVDKLEAQVQNEIGA